MLSAPIVRLRPGGGNDPSAAQVVRGVPGIVAQEFNSDRIEPAPGNHVARERRTLPVAAASCTVEAGSKIGYP